MNANELADLLETTESTNNKAATMLRQLQAEIEALKKQLEASEFLNYNKGHEDGRNLVTVKTLTDEVLMQLYEVADYSPESYLEEAKEILRKAQEK